MDLIDNASTALQILIRSGAALRIAYCFLRMTTSDEENIMYKKRVRNSVVFVVIAELVWILKALVITYFG